MFYKSDRPLTAYPQYLVSMEYHLFCIKQLLVQVISYSQEYAVLLFCNLQLLKVQHDSSSYEIMVENSNTRHGERTVYTDIKQNR